jgi:hypothetical protein
LEQTTHRPTTAHGKLFIVAMLVDTALFSFRKGGIEAATPMRRTQRLAL